MDRARIEDLWARVLSGNVLSDGEQSELLEALTADPSLRAQLLGDERVDGALRTLGRTKQDGPTFAQRFHDHVAAERDKDAFAAKVWTRLERQESPASKPPQAKSTRRSTRRATGGEGRGGQLWMTLAAAGLLIAVLLFVTRSGPSGEGEKSARKSPPPPAPVHAPDPVPKDEAVKTPEPPVAPKPDVPEPPVLKPAVPEAPAVVKPAPEPPQVPKPATPEEPKKELTVAAVALLAEVRGIAFVVRDTLREPAQAGQALPLGAGLETSGPGSMVALTYPDLTRVELGADTELRDLQVARGKSFLLTRGTMDATVTKQPKALPMIVRTPHGEAKVLGTTLRIYVNDRTRLDVTEGLVELKRSIDGKTVDVPTGHSAVAALGGNMVVRPWGVIARWEFEEAKGLLALDSSERGNAAKLIGTVRIPWKQGRAMSFNGKDSYIDCGTGPAVKGTGPLTVTAWIRTSSSTDQVILQQRSATDFIGEYQWKITTGGRLQWWLASKTQETKVLSDRSVVDGKWHHVAASREKDGTLRIFIDGKPDGTSAPMAPVMLKEIAVYIGADPRDRNMYFDGEIDDVRIYERALSPQEASALAATER